MENPLCIYFTVILFTVWEPKTCVSFREFTQQCVRTGANLVSRVPPIV